MRVDIQGAMILMPARSRDERVSRSNSKALGLSLWTQRVLAFRGMVTPFRVVIV